MSDDITLPGAPAPNLVDPASGLPAGARWVAGKGKLNTGKVAVQLPDGRRSDFSEDRDEAIEAMQAVISRDDDKASAERMLAEDRASLLEYMRQGGDIPNAPVVLSGFRPNRNGDMDYTVFAGVARELTGLGAKELKDAVRSLIGKREGIYGGQTETIKVAAALKAIGTKLREATSTTDDPNPPSRPTPEAADQAPAPAQSDRAGPAGADEPAAAGGVASEAARLNKRDRRTLQEKVERPAKDGEVVASVGGDGDGGERKFYVTMVRGDRVARIAGPFDSKEAAEAKVDAARMAANEADPRSSFDAFGVSAVTSKEHKPGVLNQQLGMDAAKPDAAPPAAPATPERPTELIALRKRLSTLNALKACLQ